MSHSTATDRARHADDALAILEAALGELSRPVSDCRRALARASDSLDQRFLQGAAVTELVQLRSDLIEPDARVQPRWWTMRVTHRDGTRVEGLRMSEGTYSVGIRAPISYSTSSAPAVWRRSSSNSAEIR